MVLLCSIERQESQEKHPRSCWSLAPHSKSSTKGNVSLGKRGLQIYGPSSTSVLKSMFLSNRDTAGLCLYFEYCVDWFKKFRSNKRTGSINTVNIGLLAKYINICLSKKVKVLNSSWLSLCPRLTRGCLQANYLAAVRLNWGVSPVPWTYFQCWFT